MSQTLGINSTGRWMLGAFAAIAVTAVWQNAPEIRQTAERWACTYKIGDECVTLDDYISNVARHQADLAILEWQVFCMTPRNRSEPSCAVFYLRDN